jgi:DNA polymerase IV
MVRKILHLDLDAFFCAVEEKHELNLRGKPFAVGGSPDARGVVASCSYAARRFGVRSAMPMAMAKRLCPDLIIISHRHGTYGEESRRVFEIVRQVSERVEQISIDEAFLDVTDREETGEEIASRLQKRILDERDLPCSIGIAGNKLVAKIATDYGKALSKSEGPPNAIFVVPPGEEAAFLAPLPASALWGVGPKTAERLASLGIHTIGDIAARPPEDLSRLFGKHGIDLSRRARGIDESPVEEIHEVKSISREVTFARDISDQGTLQRTLIELGQSVGRRLRKSELLGTTVKIKVRWPDFTTITRQTTLAAPIDRDAEIIDAARALFQAAWKPTGRPVRLLGVGVSGLEPMRKPIHQLSLWEAAGNEDEENSREKKKRLEDALKDLRERFGEETIRRGPRSREDKREKQ